MMMKTEKPCVGSLLWASFSVCAVCWSASGMLSVARAQDAKLPVAAPALERVTTAVVSRNVYSAGGTVRPSAPVEGDFFGVGGRVIVDQPVKGDATLAGGSVDVRAPVGDDLRAAGGDVSVESSVGGELHAAGGSITLTPAAQVAQGATLYGGSVVVDGKVAGALKASAQKIVLNGEVGGDARLLAEQIELGPRARIAGALSYAVATELKKAEGATISGTVTRDERRDAKADRERHKEMHFEGPGWIGSLFAFFGLLACAAVFLLVFPVFSAQAQESVGTSPWLSLAVGFGTLLGVPVLAVLLFITLLGIPLGIAVFALYPVLLLVGYVVGVLFIARRAQAALRPGVPESFALRIGFFALALLLVMLLSRLPFVGALVLFLVTLAGIGACVLELYRRRLSLPVRATRAA